jgi:trk system potassium uptake protein TrkH
MRYESYLRDRYRLFIGYVGGVCTVMGLLYLSPVLLLPFFPDETDQAGVFLVTGLVLTIGGFVAWKRYAANASASNLTLQEGSAVVLLVWVVGVVGGAAPFMLANDMSFTHSVFEATSGWSTTGLSLVDVTAASNLVLFFRSLLQFAGGAGLAIITISAISAIGGVGLSVAEGRTDQLVPHIRRSSTVVVSIYVGYAIAGILALRISGMGWFDAINHALTALATGGFSTHPEGIAYFDSAIIEAILIVLMILGSINFLTAYTFLRGKFRVTLRNGEIRLAAVVLAIGIPLLVAVVTLGLYATVGKAVRVAAFEAISALTGTGFSTVTYGDWQDFGMMILIILMVIGGGTGSTSGGLKQFRVYVLYKAVRWEFKRAFMPQHAVNEPALWRGDRRTLLDDQQVRLAALFVALYIMVFIAGSLVLAADGYTMRDSLFEFASTLGTVGLSTGLTTPQLPDGVIWMQSAAMFLGRLEFFAAIIGLVKISGDIKRMLFPGKG